MKTPFKLLAALVLCWAAVPWLRAQCETTTTYEFLDGNQVSASFTAGADRFWNLVSRPQYEVPKGSGRHVSFAAAMWIGGLDSVGALHTAASTYRQGGVDFYAGPIRQGFAYNCGRGFTTPGSCWPGGMLSLSGGKTANFYANGFQVYDPQTQATLQRILPNDFLQYLSLELPNGNLLLVSAQNNSGGISKAMVFDPNGFPMPQVDTLHYLHFRGAMTAMPNGKVLISSVQGHEVYDPVAHTATIAPNPASLALEPSLHTLSNGLVLMTATTTGYLYDPQSNSWSAGPSWTLSRNAPAILTLPNGEVLIMGGTLADSITERYNVASNTISAGPYLPQRMRHMSAYNYGSQEIILTGSGFNVARDIYVLNWNTGAIREMKLPAANLPMTFDGSTIAVALSQTDNFVYVDPATGHILDQRWQDVWKVSRAQVQQFQLDFAANAVNFANYPDIETWPGNGNVWAGEDAQLAPYIDIDNDGVYDPLHDGDYPCFPGDQALWWIYNDDGPHSESDGLPLGVQVENLSYVVDCNVSPCPDTTLDYTTFHHVEVTNHGAVDLHDMHLGMFYDFDLGNYADDYVGCDSALGLAYVYNGDANDETATGYGLYPPAFGAVVLANGEIDQMGGSMAYQNDFSTIGNPETAAHYYGYLRNLWKDGSHLVNNGSNGYPGTATGTATNFIFSGDAGFCGGAPTGWYEGGPGGNQPFDRRMIQSFGPLNFPVGETVVLDYALVYARDQFGSNLSSVCKLKQDATFIKNWWATTLDRGCFNLITSSPEAPVAPVLGMHVAPNPNAGSFVLRLDAAATQALSVTMHNAQGQIVWQGRLGTGQSSLDIATEGLASGMYLLQVQDRNQFYTHKVVIAR